MEVLFTNMLGVRTHAFQVSFIISPSHLNITFRRIMHRDIKPANVFITQQGSVRGLDVFFSCHNFVKKVFHNGTNNRARKNNQNVDPLYSKIGRSWPGAFFLESND